MHTGKLSNTLENHRLYCLGRVGCRGFLFYFIYFSVFNHKYVEGLGLIVYMDGISIICIGY
jgi:hypothetical protein